MKRIIITAFAICVTALFLTNSRQTGTVVSDNFHFYGNIVDHRKDIGSSD